MKDKIFKFILILFILILLWGNIYILIPYFFEYSASIAQKLFNKFSYFIFILFVIFFVFSLIKHLFLIYGKTFIKKILLKINNFLQNKTLKKLEKNHPKITEFIKNRFVKDNFFGLPFTLLSLLIFYTIFVFLGLIEAILKFDIIVGLDDRLAAFFYAFRNDFLVNIFLWITYFGREVIVIGFFVIIIIYLFFKNRINELVSFSVGVLGSITFGSILKVIFHHSRPEYEIYIENSFSFPSNHSIIAVSFYGYLTRLLIRNSDSWKKQINYLFGFLTLAFLIGLSRLYLGVHYLSDILGGYLIGAFWLFFAIGLTEFLKGKFKNQHHKKYNTNITRLVLVIIGVTFFCLYNLFSPYKLNEGIANYGKNEKNINNFEEIFPTNYLKYSQTFLGKKAENINFIFFAKDDSKLENIFYKSGWYDSDKLDYDSIKKMGKNLLLEKPYNQAPVTPIFWNNETQNFSFQKLPDNKDIRYRHHIRIWKTGLKYNSYNIYTGVGVYDEGLAWYYLLHKIAPDIEAEVEYIFSDLNKTGNIKKSEKIQLVKPYYGKNVFGDEFYSNGNAYIVIIK